MTGAFLLKQKICESCNSFPELCNTFLLRSVHLYRVIIIYTCSAGSGKFNSIQMTTIATPIREKETNLSLAENQKGTGKISIEKIGLKGGLITCAALIIYFMVMKYLNFMQSEIAWALNTIILGAGIMLTYRHYRSRTQLNVDYLPGLLLGIITTAASVIPFVLFMYIWLSQADAALLQLLKNNSLFMGGEQITQVKAAASTMIEGICSGIIISFMMMQYYKSGFRRKSKEELIQG